VGNMISDFVKGKKKFDYPQRIQQGITLHRIIDTFTDEHEATRHAKEAFRSHYRLYSGAFVDVVYDHFLALDENEFPALTLRDFSKQVYQTLEEYQPWFPVHFATLFPHMKNQDWLFNYRSLAGTKKSFGGVVRRSLYLTESDTAGQLFERHYQLLQESYRQFWADVKPFAERQFEMLGDGNNM
jgi:acyl carrier protein phosphodiesterase